MFLALIGRLFYWQIIRAEDFKKQASSQHSSTNYISAPRGNILSSDGSWLAVMRPSWLLFAEIPKIKDDYNSIARKLAEELVDEELVDQESERIFNILNRKNAVWVPIKNKLNSEQKERIANLKISGLGFELGETRYYPEGSSSAHLLGFVGKDENGQDLGYFGLEGYYNITLSGKEGLLKKERDIKGSTLLSGSVSETSSVPGSDLLTNIDKRIQLTIEEKLGKAIEKYGAKEGNVTIMDPKTGAIYGMASYPSYDPESYSEFEGNLFRNPVISDAFEPGSIFKVIVMASGLDLGEIRPDTICTICNQPLKVDKYFIKTWNNQYRADSTMTEVLVNSDNVGMSFIAQKMGQERMYDYLNNFGIGNLTGIDLQGEANVQMRKKGSWNIVDLVTTSFGQGIAVTPIQMLRAVAVIANDGYIVVPQVVKNQTKKENLIKVISQKTADEVTAMMEEAAKNGESKWTNLTGFRVAGKTGTAQIPVAGHYDAEKTIASFVGFAPAENPKFIMLVTLREPQSSQWASETAAPLWYDIAKDLFQIFGIQPEN